MLVRGVHVDLVVVGISLATLGAVTAGLGMNLMKGSARLERHKPWLQRWRWWLGVSLACFLNASLDIVAYALAPIAIIAPIGGVTIVASVLFARAGCAGEREYVTLAQWMAIGAVVGGVAVVDVAGPHPDPVLNTTAVLAKFHKPWFSLYQAVVFISIICLYIGFFVGRIGGPNLETTIATALAGGMCSGVTQTMLKLVATCGAAWIIDGTLPFVYAEFWLALAELLVVACVLLHTLNVCLASANLALATPLYQVSVILFAIVAGCAFYGDLELATRVETLMFSLGVVAVLGGLGVLILRRDPARERLVATNEPLRREPDAPPTAEGAAGKAGAAGAAPKALESVAEGGEVGNEIIE